MNAMEGSFVIPDSPPPIAGGSDPRRTSAVAISSFVVSLVLCCPLTSLAGIGLGIAGWVMTSAPHVKGRVFAALGLGLGVLGLALQIGFGMWAYRTVYLPMLLGPSSALEAARTDGGLGLLAHFALADTPETVHNADEFVNTLRARYGAFTSGSLDRSTSAASPSPGSSRVTLDYELVFERATVRAHANIEITDAKGGLSMKLHWLEIVDPANGDLRFPAEEKKHDG